jgi:hypothetical protein
MPAWKRRKVTVEVEVIIEGGDDWIETITKALEPIKQVVGATVIAIHATEA